MQFRKGPRAFDEVRQKRQAPAERAERRGAELGVFHIGTTRPETDRILVIFCSKTRRLVGARETREGDLAAEIVRVNLNTIVPICICFH